MRRNLIKFIILGVLLLLTPISFMLGRRWRSAGYYQWKDTPGENIPLPDEVSGQFGSNVCASPDGQFIAVAGNRVMPQNVFEVKEEHAYTLLGYKHFIYVSNVYGKNFECAYRSPKSGGVASMALSPVNPHQMAFISVEFQTNHPVPETEMEMSRMARDQRLREAVGMDYIYAVEVRDMDVNVFILDTKKMVPPMLLCSLDNLPYQKLLGCPKTDLSGYSDLQIKGMNESKSFRESGVFIPWRTRLGLETQLRFITWLSSGNGFLASDGLSITKIDLSGNKFPFYTAPEKSHIMGHLFCHASGDVTFIEFNHSGSTAASYLTRVDPNGNVLSKTRDVVVPKLMRFDDPPLPLVGEHRIATSGNKPENMHGAFLQITPLSLNLDDWKDRAKTYDIYDPNRVQFYYKPMVFLNDEKELLLLKRRAYSLSRPEEYPNWEVTPVTTENAVAPWVELRRMKIE